MRITKTKFLLTACYLLLVTFILSGCVVRHYPVTKDRVDQDLSSGNRGYIYGNVPPSDTKARKPTRKTHTVEIELSNPLKIKNLPPVDETKKEAVLGQKAEETPAGEEMAMEPVAESAIFQAYTVDKDDTLQKISQKFYGTTKNWMKIYEANKDVLKSPDRVYPGQEINIPQE